jgi:DnaK suppressor protein
MNNVDVLRLRRYLEIHREEALRRLDQLAVETRGLEAGGPQDTVELSENNVSKESLFQRSSERRRFLHMVDAALARMQQGNYGICACCGDEIDPPRLDALPWTLYCLLCQQAFERRGKAEQRPSSADHRLTFKRAG